MSLFYLSTIVISLDSYENSIKWIVVVGTYYLFRTN